MNPIRATASILFMSLALYACDRHADVPNATSTSVTTSTTSVQTTVTPSSTSLTTTDVPSATAVTNSTASQTTTQSTTTK